MISCRRTNQEIIAVMQWALDSVARHNKGMDEFLSGILSKTSPDACDDSQVDHGCPAEVLDVGVHA